MKDFKIFGKGMKSDSLSTTLNINLNRTSIKSNLSGEFFRILLSDFSKVFSKILLKVFNSKLFFILFFVLFLALFLSNSFTSAQNLKQTNYSYIQISKTSYLLGESVFFRIIDKANEKNIDQTNSYVEISNGQRTFRMIGDLTEDNIFIPNEIGQYTIYLKRVFSNQIIDSIGFDVVFENQKNSISKVIPKNMYDVSGSLDLDLSPKENLDSKPTLFTDKINYILNESVNIFFNLPTGEYELMIENDESKFSFIDSPNSPVLFFPRIVGKYEVFLLNRKTKDLYSSKFNVYTEYEYNKIGYHEFENNQYIENKEYNPNSSYQNLVSLNGYNVSVSLNDNFGLGYYKENQKNDSNKDYSNNGNISGGNTFIISDESKINSIVFNAKKTQLNFSVKFFERQNISFRPINELSSYEDLTNSQNQEKSSNDDLLNEAVSVAESEAVNEPIKGPINKTLNEPINENANKNITEIANEVFDENRIVSMNRAPIIKYDLPKNQALIEKGYLALEENKIYDIEIEPNGIIKSFEIRNAKYNSEVEIGFDEISPEKYTKIKESFEESFKESNLAEKKIVEKTKNIVKSYAINLDFEFEEASFKTVARGTELYKCKDWNFSEQICYGDWVKVMDLTIGEEYDVKLYPGDPCFLEVGVASVNTDKSIYHPNESSNITIVVLDTLGFLVEDALVNLNITSPLGDIHVFSTENYSIVETSKGIYNAIFDSTNQEGSYYMSVSALGKNTNSSMQSYFLVSEFYEFEIIRNTPVTIDPFKEPHTSSIRISSFINVSSFDFIEKLPSNFTVLDSGGAEVSYEGNYIFLRWKNLTNNSLVSYVFNAPLVTPYLWEMGPSEVHYSPLENGLESEINSVFYEARPWLLAVDPIYFYDPYISYLTGWSSGTGITYAEVDDGIRQPNTPGTGDYVSSLVNTGKTSQFGFRNITQTGIENITLWVYLATGRNARFTFYLYQGSTSRCSLAIGTSQSGWKSCTWNSPTGDLSNLSVYLGNPTKSGGGANTYATVYAAYISVDTGDSPPSVVLNYPTNNLIVNSTPISFNFTATDPKYSTISNCTLYANFSGSWAKNITIHNVTNNTIRNITISPADGTYIWNVNCTNSAGKSNSSASNLTVKINSVLPIIQNQALNGTTIRQNRTIRFNASITDFYGISSAIVTLKYPSGESYNYSLSQSGNEFYTLFTNTTAPGIYNVTLIWANDSLGQIGKNESPSLSFTVEAVLPEPFSLLSPENSIETTTTLPTMLWSQTSTPDFKNYTLLIDSDIFFSSPDFTYYTNDIATTSYLLDYALYSNTKYYWKVIAYDIFGNSRNSSETYIYIIDSIAPTILLNSPENQSNKTNALVNFTFTPSDTNTLDSCVLYGNFSGSWNENETLISVANNTINWINITLLESNYIWGIWCNDSAGNSRYSVNSTFTLDISGPNISLLSPEPDALITDTNVVIFSINASDKFGDISECSLIVNDSIRQTQYDVIDGQVYNFSQFLENNYYSWRVNCTDTNGIENTSETRFINITSIDNDPPLITLNYPILDDFVSTQDIVFNYTAEDATGIENCSLYINGVFNQSNDTIENLADNFFTAKGFSNGKYFFRVDCFDNSTIHSFSQSDTYNFTVDLENPIVSISLPYNDSYLNYSDVVFTFTGSDLNLDYCALYGNFSGPFEEKARNSTPNNGTSSTITSGISDGIYEWNIFCFDRSGRSGFNSNNYTLVVDTTPPQYSGLSVSPSSPTNYSESQVYEFNISWIDYIEIDTVIFQSNFTGEIVEEEINPLLGNLYSINKTGISARNYFYNWIANDTSANVNSTGVQSYVINRSESSIVLEINGSEDNITINQNTIVNITTYLTNPSGGYIELYVSDELIDNGTGTLSNLINFTEPGSYNVTSVFYDCENYTGVSKTFFVESLDVLAPVVNLIFPENDSSIGINDAIFQYNVSDYSDIENCSLYLNGSRDQYEENPQRNTTLFFNADLEETDYLWKVVCYDSNGYVGESQSRIVHAVDNDAIKVLVNTTKPEYEKGDNLIAFTNTTDFFSNPLVTDVTSHLIKGETNVFWWNESWAKRKPIYLNETTGSGQTNAITQVNITALNGNISSCQNELRIIYHYGATASEVPFEVYAGDDSTWCLVGFRANISASAINYLRYYAYYNYSGAINPGYELATSASVLFNAQASGQDEGSVLNVGNIIGNNDNTYAEISVSGGGAGQESAHGRDFINSTPGDDIIKVQARYRYEVTAMSGSWYLRYSVNDGTSYTDATLGTGTVAKSTSSWTDITSAYPTLSWSELNKTRLQGRVTKGSGSGTSTMRLYWVEMNVTYRLNSQINQTGVGDEQIFIYKNTSETNTSGLTEFNWSTANQSYGSYSIVSVATKTLYSDSSGYNVFEIVPDTTAPNVTLVLPGDGDEKGVGLVNFTYTPYDINLENCTLYFGKDGEFNSNKTHSNPNNSVNNTFDLISMGLGLYEWNVLCYDSEGNYGFADANFTLNITGPDLTVNQSGIWFSEDLRVEGNNVTIYANISNFGLTDANESFVVQFFKGDPLLGGTMIGDNVTVNSLIQGETVTINTSYSLDAGKNNIFVLINPDELLNESDYSNNKANNTIEVELYHYFYGNVSTDFVLATYDSKRLIDFSNVSNQSGNILVADYDSSFLFSNLIALGRTINGNPASDLTDLDKNIGTENFTDSIRNVWGGGSESPIETASFNLSTGLIENVPVFNSTNNSNFKTGILWDKADDGGNLQYDVVDKEDVVFITKINSNGEGKYGVYDYEIRVPAMLRGYKTGNNKLAFYVEIN